MPAGDHGPAIVTLDPADEARLEIVATRMRRTLMEVLDDETGRAMYSMDWLRDRVRWHLDPARCTGQVFLALDRDEDVCGHTIVRLEVDEHGRSVGLFSTTYVAPEARRLGVAKALLETGERWLIERGVQTLATNTAEDNERLIRLFEQRGYAIVLRVPDRKMVRLERTVT